MWRIRDVLPRTRAKEKWDDVQKALGEAGGVACDPVGAVIGGDLEAGGYVILPLSEMKEAYEHDLFE